MVFPETIKLKTAIAKLENEEYEVDTSEYDEEIRRNAIKEFKKTVNKRIDDVLRQLNYQHGGEDLQNGLIIAQTIINHC